MARALAPTVLAAMGKDTRRPDYTVHIYDVRSTLSDTTPTTIGDIVLVQTGSPNAPVLPAIVGPRDFSADCDSIDITEIAGDYAANGIASSSINARIQDPHTLLDPLLNPDPADGRWLRQGNVVVIREGDASEPNTSLWPITFTGVLVGQPGRTEDRVSATAFLSVKANSREADFLRRINTTENFGVSKGYAAMARDIAETDMGLDPDEITWASFGTLATVFLSTQFVEESPLISIAKIMFPDGFMPHFEGDGRLGFTTGSITKTPSRIYPNSKSQIRVTRPIVIEDGVNEVRIIGINATMEEVLQERQDLATASATSGFFTDNIKIPVQWSDDGTQQARDVRFEVDSSVEAGIFNFGSERFSANIQTDGASVDGDIEIDGSLAVSIILAVYVAGLWISTSFIPDAWAGVGAGNTIPIGRPINAAIGQILFSILGSVGRGQYRITGQPFENVFAELTTVARVSTTDPTRRKELVIENHLVNDETTCDTVAERVLKRERAKQNSRNIEMIHDLVLEVDDVLEVNSRRYMIQTIKRRLFRGAGAGLASLVAFEITPGVRP